MIENSFREVCVEEVRRDEVVDEVVETKFLKLEMKLWDEVSLEEVEMKFWEEVSLEEVEKK